MNFLKKLTSIITELFKRFFNLISRLLRDVLISLLLLSVAFVLASCAFEPFVEILPLGLSSFAILATFCGLCLRWTSTITEEFDKRLALQCGEKCFLILFVFAILLSLRAGIYFLSATQIGKRYNDPIHLFEIIAIIIIIGPIILFMISGMKDVGRLILIRLLKWDRDNYSKSTGLNEEGASGDQRPE